MKPVSIHPFSALAGAGLLGLVLVATGAMQVRGSVQALPLYGPGPMRVAGIPTPQQMLHILEGQPLTVPPSKVFVATGIAGTVYQNYNATVAIDGTVVLHAATAGGVVSLPPGLTAPAGSVVTVSTVSGNGPSIILGYMVDA